MSSRLSTRVLPLHTPSSTLTRPSLRGGGAVPPPGSGRLGAVSGGKCAEGTEPALSVLPVAARARLRPAFRRPLGVHGPDARVPLDHRLGEGGVRQPQLRRRSAHRVRLLHRGSRPDLGAALRLAAVRRALAAGQLAAGPSEISRLSRRIPLANR